MLHFFDEHRRQTLRFPGEQPISIGVVPVEGDCLGPLSLFPQSCAQQSLVEAISANTRRGGPWRVVVVNGELVGSRDEHPGLVADEVFPTRTEANARALQWARQEFSERGFPTPDPSNAPLRPGLSMASWFASLCLGLFEAGAFFMIFFGSWTSANNNIASLAVGISAVVIGPLTVLVGRILWLKVQRSRGIRADGGRASS